MANNSINNNTNTNVNTNTNTNTNTETLKERGDRLVRIVEALIAHSFRESDYCPECGQNLFSTVSKSCCNACSSSCNLQGGCNSPDCIYKEEGEEVRIPWFPRGKPLGKGWKDWHTAT